jgi:hypothetical protein
MEMHEKISKLGPNPIKENKKSRIKENKKSRIKENKKSRAA